MKWLMVVLTCYVMEYFKAIIFIIKIKKANTSNGSKIIIQVV